MIDEEAGGGWFSCLENRFHCKPKSAMVETNQYPWGYFMNTTVNKLGTQTRWFGMILLLLASPLCLAQETGENAGTTRMDVEAATGGNRFVLTPTNAIISWQPTLTSQTQVMTNLGISRETTTLNWTMQKHSFRSASR